MNLAAVLTMRGVENTLRKYAFRYADEAQLHQGIIDVFKKEGVRFEHEKVHEPTGDRFDFLLENGVVVEVKMAGSQAEALRQVNRYTLQPEVQGIVLVTTKPWKLYATRADGNGVVVTDGELRELNGKPLKYVQVRGQSF